MTSFEQIEAASNYMFSKGPVRRKLKMVKEKKESVNEVSDSCDLEQTDRQRREESCVLEDLL